MAQSWAAKQTGFTQTYSGQVNAFLDLIDYFTLANAEFTNDAYGSGGANALTDAIVQTVIPQATAAIFDSAEGAMVTILTDVASLRGYLEAIRTATTQ